MMKRQEVRICEAGLLTCDANYQWWWWGGGVREWLLLLLIYSISYKTLGFYYLPPTD